ncbi:Carboxylesterase NlhH [Stieleria neptunia]|uniref:Carboxylesterase NlhH n=1 Tax=Stieleria neptunia TaxID=2527979 RepID=A0A518HM43_9BACT|nr:alpha/beta hydrolase [Stieleria neptunia]QDV41915.1 Carboxylesterase NlhH [Stieleria neptunia]
MPLHPQAKAFVDTLAEEDRPSWEELGVEKAREVFLTFEEMCGDAPELARIDDHTMPCGLRLRLYSDHATAVPVTVFFHGGGWVLGNLDTHDAFCRRLADASGCAVVAVDYRLSPEHPFPGPIEDCYRATQYVVENAARLNVDASRLAVAGDSAGGHLAASVAIKARDRADFPIALQVLLYPVIEPNFETPSYREFADGFGLTRDTMRWFWQQFLGGRAAAPEAAPSHAESHQDLPPALVITAEYDVLRDEGNRYAQRLQTSGVDVQHRQQDGMLHAFLHFAGIFDTGMEVGQHVAAEIGARLRGSIS